MYGCKLKEYAALVPCFAVTLALEVTNRKAKKKGSDSREGACSVADFFVIIIMWGPEPSTGSVDAETEDVLDLATQHMAIDDSWDCFNPLAYLIPGAAEEKVERFAGGNGSFRRSLHRRSLQSKKIHAENEASYQQVLDIALHCKIKVNSRKRGRIHPGVPKADS